MPPQADCPCRNLPDQIDFMTIDSLKELRPFLTRIDADEKDWSTTFRCRECGQLWLERYETHGHCEVPFVQKHS